MNDSEQVFIDICDELGCARDNEAALAAIAALKRQSTAPVEVTFTYKNYRGEVSVRLVCPIMIAFGRTGFHPEPQWLLHAWDLNKEAERTFAMKDISDWDPK